MRASLWKFSTKDCACLHAHLQCSSRNGLVVLNLSGRRLRLFAEAGQQEHDDSKEKNKEAPPEVDIDAQRGFERFLVGGGEQSINGENDPKQAEHQSNGQADIKLHSKRFTKK